MQRESPERSRASKGEDVYRHSPVGPCHAANCFDLDSCAAGIAHPQPTRLPQFTPRSNQQVESTGSGAFSGAKSEQDCRER
jgi:hypothetical protein